MVRFIDLSGQILDEESPHFAWFDTVTGKFITFNGCQEWTDLNDFLLDFDGENQQREIDLPLVRFLQLIPSDYFEK